MSQAYRYRTLWRLLFAAAVLGTLLVSVMPESPSTSVSINDKLGHVVAYAINGALAVLAFPSIAGARWALLGLLAMGSGLELVQIVLPTRSGSWIDVGANALGLCGGAISLLRRKENNG